MKKVPICLALLAICAALAFPQTAHARPRLGILPFTGGAGEDGEAIATLLSFQPEIMSAFTVVPRTGAVNAILEEHRFQMTGYTDSDTIAGIGRMLGADFVISGNIRRLGNRNMIIASIVNVETFEQVAGYFRTYRDLREVRGFLPSMSQSLIRAAVGRDTSGLPSLAIPPLAGGIDAQDAETLAQILAIEILNSGAFVILPRVSAMQAVRAEHDFQLQGHVADEELVALGRAINADLVLSARVQSLAGINMFTAQILDVRDGSLVGGAARDYRVLADGINLMAEIAILLTDPDPASAQARIAAHNRRRSLAALLEDPTRFWSVGLGAGSSFAEPWAVGTFRATLAPFRHSFFRLGVDVGFLSGDDDIDYFLITPFAHYAFFMPFESLPIPLDRGGWHVGAGFGFMFEEYSIPAHDITVPVRSFVVDFVTGVNFANLIDVSYTLRTDFSAAVHKVSLGFTHRFQPRGVSR